MTIICDVTGSDRKHLAQALGEIISEKPIYLKAPTYAYQVGDYTISRDSEIICPDSATPEEVEKIITKLTAEGFSPVLSGDISTDVSPDETPSTPEVSASDGEPEVETENPAEGAETPDEDKEPAEEDAPKEAIAGPDDDTRLTISIPRSKVPDDVLIRLQAIVLNKKVLFQRALQTNALPIETTNEEVSFPWFTLTGIDGEAEAYAQFITHLVKMADEQTRVLDKPYDGDNDKFAMRIFMVRMGMKGTQFALIRKLMMKNLTGNSGWRYGAPPKKEEAHADAPAEMPDVAPETEPESQPELETESPAESVDAPDVADPAEDISQVENAPEDTPDTPEDSEEDDSNEE